MSLAFPYHFRTKSLGFPYHLLLIFLPLPYHPLMVALIVDPPYDLLINDLEIDQRFANGLNDSTNR